MTDLPTLSADMASTIKLATRFLPHVDRIDRRRLMDFRDRLERYLERAHLGIDQPHRRIETETLLGPNMYGPAINDIIHQVQEICGRVQEMGRAA
jgi:hypothetical protein